MGLREIIIVVLVWIIMIYAFSVFDEENTPAGGGANNTGIEGQFPSLSLWWEKIQTGDFVDSRERPASNYYG